MRQTHTPHTRPPAQQMGKTVITFGTYDLFHYGHLRIIQRARQLGDRLVVGVSSDALNYSKKAEYPAVPARPPHGGRQSDQRCG